MPLSLTPAAPASSRPPKVVPSSRPATDAETRFQTALDQRTRPTRPSEAKPADKRPPAAKPGDNESEAAASEAEAEPQAAPTASLPSAKDAGEDPQPNAEETVAEEAAKQDKAAKQDGDGSPTVEMPPQSVEMVAAPPAPVAIEAPPIVEAEPSSSPAKAEILSLPGQPNGQAAISADPSTTTEHPANSSPTAAATAPGSVVREASTEADVPSDSGKSSPVALAKSPALATQPGAVAPLAANRAQPESTDIQSPTGMSSGFDAPPAPQATEALSGQAANAPVAPTTRATSHSADAAPQLALHLDAPAESPRPEKAAIASPVPTPASEARFAEANHPNLITHIRTQLLPDGGRMQIRLDPPELGALQVMVRMENGVMTASFETSSEQAARLLSHSLNQLKSMLESQGVQVEKLQVQQAPRDFDARNQEQSRQQSNPDDRSQHQEQQRRQMLRRMWAKLGLGDVPLDVTG